MKRTRCAWICAALGLLLDLASVGAVPTRASIPATGPADGGRDAEVRQLVDSRMREMIDDLLDETLAGVATRNLRQQGERCAPYLIAALKDPRFQESAEDDSQTGLPLARVASLLREIAPHAAVPELAALLKSSKPAVRIEAAFQMGHAWEAGCVGPIVELLAGDDRRMKNEVVWGMAGAMHKDEAPAAFRSPIFDPLASLLTTDEQSVEDVPRCLLWVDRDRAVRVLLDNKLFSPSSPLLLDILKALKNSRAAVPTGRVIDLLGQLRPQADRCPGDEAYGLGLMILAYNQDPEIEALIDEALMWGNKTVRIAALRARCALAGLESFRTYLYDLERKRGWQRLPAPQSKVLYVLRLVNHVEKDGLDDYFSCSYCGGNAARALSALRDIGATNDARLLERAMNLFGPDGPSTDADVRDEQLSAMSPRQQTQFNRLSEQFRKDQDEREILILQYVLKHPDRFRSAKPTTAPR